MEVISQIPWPVLSCLSARSTVVFMSEIDAVDALFDVLLSDDSLRPVQVVWSAEHMINTIDNSVIPRSIVPTVSDCFFQAYTGSTILLMPALVSNSVLDYEVSYLRRFRCLY